MEIIQNPPAISVCRRLLFFDHIKIAINDKGGLFLSCITYYKKNMFILEQTKKNTHTSTSPLRPLLYAHSPGKVKYGKTIVWSGSLEQARLAASEK